MHTLENDNLLIEISDHGAELCRIYNKLTSKEILWNGDAAFWNRHAPVLFPIVGAVAGGVYRAEGREYHLGQHGFARDMEFDCIAQTDCSITHQLTSSDETKAKYPYDFILTITHTLTEKTVTVNWRVENPANRRLYFSIGGHPAFNTVPGTYLSVPGHEKLTYIQISKNGTALPEEKQLITPGGRYQIPTDMFDKDVFIFENSQLSLVGLLNPDGTPLVTMHCPDFPYVGIWSKPGAPFVCLEPWFGRTDDEGYTGDFSQKTGIRELDAKDTFQVSYELCFS